MKQHKPLPATDPDVRVPAAVRRAADRAEQHFQPSNLPADGNDTVTPAGNDEVTLRPPQPNGSGNPPPAEASPPARPGAEPAAPPAQPMTIEEWEHRYNSMKGRFEQSEKRNRDLSGEVSRLHGLLATMSTAAPPPPRTAGPGPANGGEPLAATPADVRFRITPEEEQEYGKEFLELVGKKAGQIAADMTSDLRAEVEALKGQIGSVGSHMARSAFEDMVETLDIQVPTWRQINDDPEFLRWLRLQDPYSGAIRHELLKAAWQRNDTPRVLAFFKGFLNEEAAVDPARGQVPPAGNPPPAARPDLITLAAPGRAKSGASTPPADEKPIITRAQISNFYRLVNAGHYAGKDAEKNALEQQIFDAQREGRIQ